MDRTADELKAQGWTWDNDAVCTRCGDEVEWWTSKNGLPLPFNPMLTGTSKATPHKETCSG